eukprot:1513525-Rhodomonas_salina.1
MRVGWPECSIEDFEVPYDHLVVGVGASVNTFGIPGVKEHCYFLKQVAILAQKPCCWTLDPNCVT